MDNKLVKQIESQYVDWIRIVESTLIQQDRAFPTAIIASRILPTTEQAAIQAFGLSTLWLFGVDRVFDEIEYKSVDMESFVQNIMHLLDSSEDLHQDTLSPEEKDLQKSLTSLLEKLSKYNSFKILEVEIRKEFVNVIKNGMYVFSQMKQDKVSIPRTLEEYLVFGANSIGVKFVNICVLCGLGETISEESRGLFDQAQKLSAEIIRLTNDLVTYKKELEEGNINSVSIVGNDLESSSELIKTTIKSKLIEFENCLVSLSSYMPLFSVYCRKLVQVTLGFYKVSDFYDDRASLTDKHLDQ